MCQYFHYAFPSLPLHSVGAPSAIVWLGKNCWCGWGMVRVEGGVNPCTGSMQSAPVEIPNYKATAQGL